MDHPGPGKPARAIHGWMGGGGILETKDHDHPVYLIEFQQLSYFHMQMISGASMSEQLVLLI